MKQLITRRAMIIFVGTTAALIAITSFTLGYSDGSINLSNPILVVVVAAAVAFATEGILQSLRK